MLKLVWGCKEAISDMVSGKVLAQEACELCISSNSQRFYLMIQCLICLQDLNSEHPWHIIIECLNLLIRFIGNMHHYFCIVN